MAQTNRALRPRASESAELLSERTAGPGAERSVGPAVERSAGPVSERTGKPLSERTAGPIAEARSSDETWPEILVQLRDAAELAAEHGVASELFMQAAWAACLDARPALREQLADKELRTQLKKLRKRGLVGSA